MRLRLNEFRKIIRDELINLVIESSDLLREEELSDILADVEEEDDEDDDGPSDDGPSDDDDDSKDDSPDDDSDEDDEDDEDDDDDEDEEPKKELPKPEFEEEAGMLHVTKVWNDDHRVRIPAPNRASGTVQIMLTFQQNEDQESDQFGETQITSASVQAGDTLAGNKRQIRKFKEKLESPSTYAGFNFSKKLPKLATTVSYTV